MSATFQLEWRGLDAAIAKLAAADLYLQGARLADGIGALGVAQTHRRIASEKTSPAGAKWTPNRAGTPTLMRSGSHLYDSVQHAVQGPAQVIWGSGWIGAGVHQVGATIRAVKGRALAFEIAGKKVFAKSVTIPARPWLGVSEANGREIEATAARYLAMVLQ